MNEKKKTILFIGADIKYMIDFRLPIIEKFKKAGWHAVILATRMDDFDEENLLVREVEYVPWTLSKAGLNPLKDINAILHLKDCLIKYNPEIVFSHTIKPIIYSTIVSKYTVGSRRVAMIPGLGYAFTSGWNLKKRLLSLLAWGAYALALRSSHLVIFQNDDDRQYLLKKKILSNKVETKVVDGSGVDLNRFKVAPLKPGPTTFLMMARLIREKGIYEYIEACRLVKKDIPETRFILAGGLDTNPSSIKSSEIAKWVNEGLVEVCGYVSNPQPLFEECHVFMLPSYYREGIPRTNLEAMATGRPIITTLAPGCRETVIHELNGFLIAPKNVEALSNAMKTLANDRDLVVSMGKNSRVLCESRFELNQVVQETFLHILG